MTVLDDILAACRRRLDAARKRVPLAQLERAAETRRERRDFAQALAGGNLSVIAELKQASPSRGVLRKDYNCGDLARSYESAGAAALSVLTEEQFFKGSLADLADARRAVELPVLRKDFTLDEYHVYESAAAGADALLLIVAALSDEELLHLIRLADRLRIAALVEVHTADELTRALASGARVIGINNRDLKTLEVNIETSFRLRQTIPAGYLTVSESGIKTGGDLKRLARVGFDAVLVGEHFMTSSNPGAALAEMLKDAKQEPEDRRQKTENRKQRAESKMFARSDVWR